MLRGRPGDLQEFKIDECWEGSGTLSGAGLAICEMQASGFEDLRWNGSFAEDATSRRRDRRGFCGRYSPLVWQFLLAKESAYRSQFLAALCVESFLGGVFERRKCHRRSESKRWRVEDFNIG